MRWARPLAGFLLLLLATGMPAASVVLRVDSGADGPDVAPGDGRCASATGGCTLRAAIEEANALRGEDEVALPAGRFALASGPGGGDLVVTDALRLVGAGAESVLDGAGFETGLEVAPDVRAAFRGLRIQAVGGEAAVTCREAARCRFEDVTLADNPADVALACGDCELRGSRIAGNAGIGIAWELGPLSLVGSVVEGNGGAGLRGSQRGRGLALRETIVRDNRAGGIETGGRVAIERSAIVANRRDEGCGGGLRLEGGRTSGSTLIASTLSGNRAPRGGGLCLLWQGGNLNPFVGILASTIHANRAERGGGIGVVPELQHLGPPGPGFQLQASILAGNRASEAPDCLAPALRRSGEPSAHSLGWNLIGDPDGCGIEPRTSDHLGSAAAPLDPQLAPLALHDGTPAHAPAPGSPALSRIPPADCATSPITHPVYRQRPVRVSASSRLARTGLEAARDTRWLVFSGWFAFERPIGEVEHLLSAGDGRTPEGWFLRIAREADGRLALGVRDAGGRTILDARSLRPIESGELHSLVFGFNSGINSLDAFVDDVELLFEKRPGSRGIIPYATRSEATWRLFGRHDGGGEAFVGRAADVWLDDEFLSVDSGAHRYDFYDLNHRPLDLGEDGSRATRGRDHPAVLYLGRHMRAEDWNRGTQLGRGGDFAQAGGFADAAEPAPDPPPVVDQRGRERPRGGACEVGALELE